MEYTTLLKANLKRHKGSLVGIFVLVFTLSLALSTVLTVWINSGSYLPSEVSRAGFGKLTAWVSNLPDTRAVIGEIENSTEIEKVEAQSLIYSEYEVNGQESDSEGQLITFVPTENRYRFFTEDLSGYIEEAPTIAPGEVYVSPSLISMFDVSIGDEITFPIARQGRNVSFTVKGYYADPFMGSSMIGMKGFLVCEADRAEILQTIQSTGIDALAKDGAMLHIFTEESSRLTASELSALINESTSLPQYTEFVHSESAISGFMLILQNAFCGLLVAFVAVLLAAVLVVLGHSIGSTMEADFVNMGILKTLGLTGGKLRRIWVSGYLGIIVMGMLLGLALSAPFSHFLGSATLTTTGILIPTTLPVSRCILSFGAILLALILFMIGKTNRIGSITPMKAIRGETVSVQIGTEQTAPIRPQGLYFWLALRQLITGRKNYIGACVVAVMLVFFASLVGRMDAWLGADGKGMMDAFNPADHDIGVQAIGNLTSQEVENAVLQYTNITDSYQLAMESISVEGIDYTANAITEPERFHMLKGNPCINDNEIVLTEFVAADLGVSVGDTLTASASRGSAEFIVSGIYQCANDMGANIGMSREGYLKIAEDNPRIWCHHYFLADTSQKETITDALEAAYGGDVHVHKNTWPGLLGIISAMQALMVFLYAVMIIFILVVTVLTASKILSAEQRDIGIYKALGFSTMRLRMTFALRFAIIALAGSAMGTILAAVLTDPLVSAVMKLCGISNFQSSPSVVSILFPAAVVTMLFSLFAYFAAGKIKKTDLTILIAE